jgi:hypothetical protein
MVAREATQEVGRSVATVCTLIGQLPYMVRM